MEFVQNVVDYGEAPEIYVTGCNRVTRVSNGTVRIALFTEREGNDGEIERKVVAHLLCDAEMLPEAAAAFSQAAADLRSMIPLKRQRMICCGSSH